VLNRARAVLRLQPAGARFHSLLKKQSFVSRHAFTACGNSSPSAIATDPHHVVIPIAADTYRIVIPTRERSETGGICFGSRIQPSKWNFFAGKGTPGEAANSCPLLTDF
jgi:hypothetical protein